MFDLPTFPGLHPVCWKLLPDCSRESIFSPRLFSPASFKPPPRAKMKGCCGCTRSFQVGPWVGLPGGFTALRGWIGSRRSVTPLPAKVAAAITRTNFLIERPVTVRTVRGPKPSGRFEMEASGGI